MRHTRKCFKSLGNGNIQFFRNNFFGSLIRACTGSFANVLLAVNLEDIKLGQIFGSPKNGSCALVDARNFFFLIY